MRAHLHLVLNGRVIDDSSIRRENDDISGWVSDRAAVTLLLECRPAEITDHFSWLSLSLPEPPSDAFHEIHIHHKRDNYSKTPQLDFSFEPAFDHWAKPWSIFDFASTLKKVVENCSIPGLSFFQGDEESIVSYSALWVEPPTSEDTIQQVLDYWLPIIQEMCKEAEAILTASVHKGSIVALFNFAPEVKTACEQYLIYFVQFLEDLGIQAIADLQEQTRGMLFTVTPQSGPEALERIQEALAVYLQIPGSPDLEAEVARHNDIAVLQLAANVRHLQSQLMLTQAMLEAKNATIRGLEAENLYYQLLSANPQNQGQLPGARSDDPQRDESILGGAVTITKANWKGNQVNLPLIFRELKRRFRGEK
jgi:hypothetical protein